MRHQQKIYNQTGRFVRNRDSLNVNMSSDFCVFISPTFSVSGATTIIDDSDTCEFSGVSFYNMLTGATDSCTGLTLSCIDTVDWSTRIYADGDIQYSGDFATTTSTGTPTTSIFIDGVEKGLGALGYTYSVDGTELTVQKPFGVSELQIDVCLDVLPDYVSTACTFTGSCEVYCESACTQDYETITSASTGVYVVTDEEGDITLDIDFTGNTSSFSDDMIFKYEVYKYNHTTGVFVDPAVYKSDDYTYDSFSATSAITTTVPISELQIDGDYLLKGYYVHDVCTDILGRLGLVNDTSLFKGGTQYGLYTPENDYYFVACKKAEVPQFGYVATELTRPLGSLIGYSILPTGQTQFTITTNVEGDLLVYLNGLLLAEDLDYTFTGGNLLELSGATMVGDVLTYVSVANSETNGLVVDNINISKPIVSGATDGEGSEVVYFNTTEGKYELFTQLTPANGNNMVVTLNGVTLAPNIDYYQSISNAKRIILEGDLIVGDVINIVYNAYPTYVGNIFTNTPRINWTIPAPELANGIFTVEVATDSTFGTIVSTATTNYVGNQSAYGAEVVITGTVGTELVYRVCNEKNYVTVVGDEITTRAYSETVPIIITSNDINSY